MFAFVLVDLLLVGFTLATNANGWIPLTRPILFNQTNTRHMEIRHASGWKPFHGNDRTNSDDIKKNAILIITPNQVQKIQNDINVHVLQASSEEIPESDNTLEQNDTEHSKERPLPEDIDEDSLTNRNQNNSLSELNSRDGIQTRSIETDTHRRAPKQLWDPNLTEGSLSRDPITPDPNTEKAEVKIATIVNNVTNTNYEVTEPTSVQELTYKANDLRNDFTNKFVQILSKYNINTQDMLDNYARSKQHHNKVTHVSPSHDSLVSLFPYHYNSLNHLPLDPMLAVFLSNYGYYLKGFFGLPNRYRNLYGYSASNNIHNNKPFGSYKIYSDTDSSN